MVYFKQGANRVRDLVHNDISTGILGTSGTAASENQTSLQSEDATTELPLESKTKGDKSIKFNYLLPSTGGTTTTYKEFALKSDSVNLEYDRIVFTGISFVSGGSKDLNIVKLHRFNIN